VSIASDDDTDSTESDYESGSERDSHVTMCMEGGVDALNSVDLASGVDMDGDGEDEEDEDDEDEKEEEQVDEEEDKDEDEDNSKEPQTIGQGQMVYTSADDADTMVDDQSTVLPEQGQEMREHTPRPQHPAPAPRPETPEPRPRPGTPETKTLTGMESLGLRTQQKACPVLPTLREGEAAGNNPDVDVDLQLHSK